MDDPVKLEAISQLRFSPGFKYLMELFEEQVKEAEEELAYSPFNAGKLYGWQVMRHVHRVLRDEPEKAEEVIREERQRAPVDTPNVSGIEMFKKMQDYYRQNGIEFPPRTEDVKNFLVS